MTGYLSDVTSVSSKGQIVLPKAIRDALRIVTGAKLMVFSDGENILLKPIQEPSLSDFSDLLDAASDWAASVGMSDDDITDAIKSVRARRRSSS